MNVSRPAVKKPARAGFFLFLQMFPGIGMSWPAFSAGVPVPTPGVRLGQHEQQT
jgi:hypothetical protein